MVWVRPIRTGEFCRNKEACLSRRHKAPLASGQATQKKLVDIK